MLQNLSEELQWLYSMKIKQFISCCGADALVDQSSPILWTAPTPQLVNSTSYDLHIAAFDFYSVFLQVR